MSYQSSHNDISIEYNLQKMSLSYDIQLPRGRVEEIIKGITYKYD